MYGWTKGWPGHISCYFRFSKRGHGLDFEELSNRDIEHLSLHYMILRYYHITMLGNANGLPTIIFGARTTPLMCCWHNKQGDRLRRLFSQLGNGFPAFFCQLLVGSSSSSLPSLAVLDVVS